MRIAVLSNTTWYLHNFRLNLMLSLQAQGHEVFAIGSADPYVEKVEQAGIQHLSFNVSGDGTNPLKEANVIFQLYRTLKKQRIDLILSNTPKGNIYAGLASLPTKAITIPNVSGLGRAFIKPGMLTILIKLLYKLTFRYSQHIFFQNSDDRDLFIKYGLTKPEKTILIPGSGVDLKRFSPYLTQPHTNEKLTFILIARLMWDKGIGEYVEAARKIHQLHSNIRFQLLGQLDVANPAAISRETVEQWQEEGVIDYLGKTDDVLPFLQAADCVVLPSYREGTPRSLLEAAAVAKPIITTDTVGCRNVVDDLVSGRLCKLKCSDDLADKMQAIVEMSTEERKMMGAAGRRKIEQEFDEEIVIGRYLYTVSTYFDTPTPAI